MPNIQSPCPRKRLARPVPGRRFAPAVRRQALARRRVVSRMPSRVHAAPVSKRASAPRPSSPFVIGARTAERTTPSTERRLPAQAWRRSAVLAGSIALTLIAVGPERLVSTMPAALLEAASAATAAEQPPDKDDAAQVAAEVARIEEEAATPATNDMPEAVRRAINNATRTVGIDADYMTVVAARESSFDPEARAHRTSAAGLYQFTAGTWMRAVKMFGAKHGLAEYAELITVDDDGMVSMRQGETRTELLALRSDPKLAALMAAELARDNKLRLEHILGRHVTPAETYMAHLFGVVPAARMIDAAHSAPHTAGADLLPTAARTNPNIFSAAGTPASAREIVARIGADFHRRTGHSGASI